MSKGIKPTRTQLKERSEHIAALNEARTKFVEQIDATNVAIAALFEKLVEDQKAYNDVLYNAAEWLQEVTDGMRDAFEERSEKWVESDKGDAANRFIEEWENCGIDPIELDAPEEISSDIYDVAEDLASLPDEIDE